jgi:hypothetical protein
MFDSSWAIVFYNPSILFDGPVYATEGKKLENTVLSILDKYLSKNHHIY